LELPDTGNHSHTFPSMEEQIQAACSDLVRAFSDADYSRLELLAQSMTERFPNHPFGWRALGLAKKQRGLITEALKAMNVALEIDPNDAESLCNLGVIYKQLGDLDLAVEKYQNAIEIKPNFAVAHSNLASIFRELGKLNDAEESAQKALLIQPENADALNILGMIFHAQGKYIEAESCYKKCIVLKPENADALNNLGVICKTKGRVERAKELFLKSIELAPNSAHSYNNLGAVYKSMGDMEKAVDSFKCAIKINPSFPEALNNLGNALKDVGLYESAIKYHTLSLRASPNYAEARWARMISQIPAICFSENEIHLTRKEFLNQIKEVSSWFELNRGCNGVDMVGTQQPFYLAYQNLDNTLLMSMYGNLCVRLMGNFQEKVEGILPKMKSGSKFRIGFVGSFFYDHPVYMAITKGMLKHLNRDTI